MQCEILSGDKTVGFLRWERQGLYTRFYGEITEREVTRVVAVFEGGECSLGVPVPEKDKMVLRASMPTGRLPKGRLLQGRLQKKQQEWEPFPGGVLGGVTYPRGRKKGNLLRFSWCPGEKLPADEVMLLYRFVEEQGKSYLELCINPDGSPRLPQ